MEKVCFLVLLFFIYSFIGWIAEIIYAYCDEHKFINRGFLIGPYCPIYGVGLVLIVILLKRFIDSPLALFVLAMVICMALEYVTSFIMEKLFGARWWDYSNKRFNINGRICLELGIPFGIGGIIVMYIVNPFIEGLLLKLGSNANIISASVLAVIFIVDLIISLNVITRISKLDFSQFKDDTEVVNNKVKEYLNNLSPLMHRLISSFPDFKIRIKDIGKKITDKIVNMSNNN